MRYIHQFTSAFLLLLAFTFAACEQDNEGAIYSGDGVSFGNTALAGVEVPASDPTFTVDIYRSNGQGTLSGNVTLTTLLSSTEAELPGCSVSGYTFAEGETQTTVTVNVEPLTIGDVLTVSLTLPEEALSVGGIGSTSISVSKAYTWQSLGTGTFTDLFAFGGTYDVEIQKAEGFDRWRVIQPYEQGRAAAAAAGDTWAGTSSPAYLEFWNNGDGTIGYNDTYIGYNYDGVATQQIYACYPTALGGTTANNVWADANTAYLAPIYYVPSTGIWWGDTSTEATIVITLP